MNIAQQYLCDIHTRTANPHTYPSVHIGFPCVSMLEFWIFQNGNFPKFSVFQTKKQHVHSQESCHSKVILSVKQCINR